MKKLVLYLFLICMICSFVSMPVMAENISADIAEEIYTESITFEDEAICEFSAEEENDFTTFSLPRSDDINLFSTVEYTNEEEAAMLRDFLVERLSNMEQYQDELALDEYWFSDDSAASDLVYVNLSEFTDFNLLANSANKASTREIIAMAITGIQNKNPELFWVKNAYHWTYKIPSYKVVKIGLKFNCGVDFDVSDGLQPVIDKVNSSTFEFDGYVQAIADLIPDSYSDYEKVLFVNDYLCTNFKYDTRYYANNAAKLHISNAYDFFKEGKGVCQAYTLAFMAIMDKLDIICDTVESKEMTHIWNLVELNNKWYHIDVTWNDPCFQTLENDTFGRAMHKYFLLSTDAIQDSAHSHYGFDIENLGYEFGTEYDEVEVNFNQSFKSPFIELDGKWYNTGYNSSTGTCGLYAFNSPDFSTITSEDLETPVYDIGRWGYLGSFSYLAKYKDTILFNTPNSICLFDGNTVLELYVPEMAENEKIYGFTVKGDQIILQLATNPNESGIKNAVSDTADLVDVIYKDYDGSVLSEGFAAEGESVPEIFVPETPVRTAGLYYEYLFDKWVTEDGLTFVAQYTRQLKEGIELPAQNGITVSEIPTDIEYGHEGFKLTVTTTEETPDLGDFEINLVDEDGNPVEASSVAALDEDGNVTIKAVGTTYIQVSRCGGDDYADFNQISALVVMPKEILVTPTSGLYKYEGREDAALTYTCEEDKIIDKDKDIVSGALLRAAGEKPGVYEINLGTLKINDNYTLVLPKETVTFEIKAKLNQDVTVSEIEGTDFYYGDTLVLSAVQSNPDAITSDNELTEDEKSALNRFVFSSNNDKVATVDQDGNVNFTGVGEVKITVSNAGNFKYNAFEKVFTFNVSKREITVSDINFDEKTVSFENVLEADTALNLDFNKLVITVVGICEEDETKSNIKASNLVLTGEKADCYNLVTKEFDGAITTTNIINVNPKAENGSISGVGIYLYNVNVTLTATPNNSYKFDGWYKNNSLVSTNASYTFNTSELEGVEAKFSIQIIILPPAGGGGGGGAGGGGGRGFAANSETETSEPVITPVEWVNPFVDVDKNAWYFNDVKAIIENKLMNGTAADRFSPDEATTRGMIVTILYRLEKEPVTDADSVFTDVNSADYYGNAVAWAVANGIVNGVGNGRFAPNDEITREQFAAVLYRFASFKGLDVTSRADLSGFADNSEVSDWAIDATSWANAKGIITGTSETTISSQNGAVRAQAAAMLNRFINLCN